VPQLRPLRESMAQVYSVFDRRCRTQTALDKLAKLRRRLQRFTQLGETLKKLFSPTLEKALTCLDDTLLPSTSQAVERGNRRYRTRQKHVYRVRTHEQISARLALERWREAQAEGRQQTLASLHQGIHLRRDNWVSVIYAEALNSTTSSVILQRTDRHGILGQKPVHCQMSS
jgi:predicted DNA-binding protein (MmcQ/YjbR family)